MSGVGVRRDPVIPNTHIPDTSYPPYQVPGVYRQYGQLNIAIANMPQMYIINTSRGLIILFLLLSVGKTRRLTPLRLTPLHSLSLQRGCGEVSHLKLALDKFQRGKRPVVDGYICGRLWCKSANSSSSSGMHSRPFGASPPARSLVRITRVLGTYYPPDTFKNMK